MISSDLWRASVLWALCIVLWALCIVVAVTGWLTGMFLLYGLASWCGGVAFAEVVQIRRARQARPIPDGFRQWAAEHGYEI